MKVFFIKISTICEIRTIERTILCPQTSKTIYKGGSKHSVTSLTSSLLKEVRVKVTYFKLYVDLTALAAVT